MRTPVATRSRKSITARCSLRLAKWVTQIDHAHRIPEIVAHAVDVAVSGRPGPVVVALSEEMQKDTVSVPDLPRVPVSVAYPDPAALHKMRDMIAAAKRPIAVVGGSCWTEAGRAALGAFLVKNDIPVTVGFRRHAHYDGGQSNFAGDLGVGSDPGLLSKFKQADLILALGSRLGDAVTQGYTLLEMAGATPIVQVLPDGAEIGRVFRPALGIVSDLNAFAHALAALEPVKPTWSAWTRELRSLREAQRAVPNYEGTLNLGTVMRELETLLTPDAVVTTDAGNFAGWATRFLNFSDRQRYIGPTNGAMGYSVPASSRRRDHVPWPDGRQHGRRRRLHDDRPGTRHRVSPWRRADRSGVQQQPVRHDPHASGTRLSVARLRHPGHKSGLFRNSSRRSAAMARWSAIPPPSPRHSAAPCRAANPR